MTDYRSVYRESGQNNFTEPPREACRLDFTDIPFVEAANDKSRQKARLSRRCRILLRHLMINLRALSSGGSNPRAPKGPPKPGHYCV
jgi:hypothetical protein